AWKVCLQRLVLCEALAKSAFFFFFQAEDGIRDYKVTGVQTCALPIFVVGSGSVYSSPRDLFRIVRALLDTVYGTGAKTALVRWRSEERRVGKECRSRWWPGHYRKKTQSDVG